MEEQIQEQQQHPMHLLTNSIVFWSIMGIFAIGFVVSITGIILGANNFMNGPIHYPGLLQTAWFVWDIFLVIVVLAHFIFTASLISSTSQEAPNNPPIPSNQQATNNNDVGLAMGGSIAFVVIVIVGSWIMLYGKHLAWISFLAFIALLIFLTIDILMAHDVRKKEQHSPDPTSTNT